MLQNSGYQCQSGPWANGSQTAECSRVPSTGHLPQCGRALLGTQPLLQSMCVESQSQRRSGVWIGTVVTGDHPVLPDQEI